MDYNPWYVIGGFAIIAIVAFLLVSGYTALFLTLLAKANLKFKNILLPVVTLAVSWLIATVAAVMLASSYGLLFFSVVLTFLLLGLSYLLSRKTLRLGLWHGIFYSIGFSVIINPIWYFLFAG
jgi:hypothetical protein